MVQLGYMNCICGFPIPEYTGRMYLTISKCQYCMRSGDAEFAYKACCHDCQHGAFLEQYWLDIREEVGTAAG